MSLFRPGSGFFVAALVALSATELTACSREFDDCRSSRTCPPPSAGSAGRSPSTGGSSGAGQGGASGASAGRDAEVPSGNGGESGGDAGGSGAGAHAGGSGGNGGRVDDAGKGGRGGSGNSTSNGGEAGDTGAAAAGGEGGMVGPVVDTEPPFVVSVSPEDGEKGVRSDAEIVITFSEPMDRIEAEKAYESARLPPSDVTFSWSSGGRVLTVMPNEPLAYGTVGGLSIPGEPGASSLPYEIAITTVARDEAGNRLAEERLFSFMTLRKVQQSLTRIEAARLRSNDAVPVALKDACAVEPDGVTEVGDMATGLNCALLATFSTAMTPGYETPDDFLDAKLQFTSTGSTSDLGALHLYRVRLDDSSDATWAMGVEEDVPLTSSGASTVSWSATVKTGVAADLAERDDGRTQFFLRHDTPNDGDTVDDMLYVACPSIRLIVTYLAP